jgi:UDP-glucose 4-epimerase
MKQVALAVRQLVGSAYVDVIGARHGEKMHESLLTAEELSRAENIEDNFFRVPADNRSLNYQSEHGGKLLEHGYTSKEQTIDLEPLVELIRPLIA